MAAGGVSDVMDLLARTPAGGVTALIQEAGELITVPAGRWHQVFHLSASIAVAGQQLSPVPSLLSSSLAHMLSWATSKGQGIIPTDKLALVDQELVSSISSKKRSKKEQAELVSQVLTRAIILRHGEEEGNRLIDLIHSDNPE